ncbi:MAG: glycosyltransferase family 4 protein, partial [Sphingomicrobium sp.]
FRPDIIWTSLSRATLLGQLVGARRRIPVVSWQHAAFLRPANRRLLRTTRRLTALWVGDSAAVTDFTARELGVPPSRLATWPIFAGDAAAPQAAAWQPGQPLRIASLGRLHPVKGYDVLIAALARLAPGGQPFEMTIGGDGDQRAQLQADAAKAGLTNLTLAGFVADPQAFLAAQHLYVQPSRSEGFCVAAHQAMQAGLPVIASDVGELAHSIVPGVTGDLVPPGDAAALAAALRRCLDHPAALHNMGVAARARLLATFSEDQFRRGAAAIYQRLGALSRSGRPPAQQASDRSA